jgi:hypothetical protein
LWNAPLILPGSDDRHRLRWPEVVVWHEKIGGVLSDGLAFAPDPVRLSKNRYDDEKPPFLRHHGRPGMGVCKHDSEGTRCLAG